MVARTGAARGMQKMVICQTAGVSPIRVRTFASLGSLRGGPYRSRRHEIAIRGYLHSYHLSGSSRSTGSGQRQQKKCTGTPCKHRARHQSAATCTPTCSIQAIELRNKRAFSSMQAHGHGSDHVVHSCFNSSSSESLTRIAALSHFGRSADVGPWARGEPQLLYVWPSARGSR